MSRPWFPLALGAAAGLFGGALVARYRVDKQRAITLLLAGSRLARTRRGPIEYAAVGDGPAVLISPGGGGGYDQGLYLAALFRGFGLRLIAVSRPGYLRTPLTTGRTPEEQADAYAELLDSLGVSQAAVLAVSAGVPAAVQFAVRYPERCWGLVLAPACNGPPVLPAPIRGVQALLLHSDFVPWLLQRVAERAVLAWNGVGPEVLRRVRSDPEKMAVLRGLLLADVTASLRRAGQRNDREQVNALPGHVLERVTAPVLVVHCPTDPAGAFIPGEVPARSIAGAHLLSVPEGGHLCLVTHKEEVVPHVVRFLRRHAPQVANLAAALGG